MQRRAAAVYFVLFALLGVGAYGYMQVGMSQPTVDLGGEAYEQGAEFTVDGRTYTVTTVSAEEGEEAGSVDYEAELTWFNESARATATLENGSTMPFRDGSYAVQIPNGSESTFSLVEQFNVSAQLAADPDVEDQTLTRDGQEFVRYTNGTTQPLAEYLPAADTATFAVGDEIDYQAENVTATVNAVGGEEVTLAWTSPANQTISFSQGENITLNGQPYFGYFPSEETVKVLPREEFYGQYAATLSDIDYYQSRVSGMWGIVIISLLASIVLLSAAYLPNK